VQPQHQDAADDDNHSNQQDHHGVHQQQLPERRITTRTGLILRFAAAGIETQISSSTV
jgi:hypothetical protein